MTIKINLPMLSKIHNIPSLEITRINALASAHLLHEFPRDLAKYKNIIPIDIENGSLIVAMTGFNLLELLFSLRETLGVSIVPVLAQANDIQQIVRNYNDSFGPDIDPIESGIADGSTFQGYSNVLNRANADYVPLAAYSSFLVTYLLDSKAQLMRINLTNKEATVYFDDDRTPFATFPYPLCQALLVRVMIMCSLPIFKQNENWSGSISRTRAALDGSGFYDVCIDVRNETVDGQKNIFFKVGPYQKNNCI